MKLGKHTSALRNTVKAMGLSIALIASPHVAIAAAPAGATPISAETAAPAAAPVEAAVAAPAVEPTAEAAQAAVATYERMTPVEGKGMPHDAGLGLQTQYSPIGEYGSWMHDALLMPLITIITLFVLLLLVWVVARYNRRAQPVASRTSHNTLIEVIWTLVPVLILVGIAVPSIDLLAKQYKPAPEKALTIKITGNQWNWTYGYPDNGEFEITSNMLNLPNYPVINNGVRVVGSHPSDGPPSLEVDNRLVVPAGEPIRLQVTASDVIHSFAVPSLWFKLDAVPGRINEKVLHINEPGVYYGQCSELCGAKHGYMPIAVEALPRDKYNAWVLAQAGGKIDGQPEPVAEEAAAAAPAAQASAAASAPAADASVAATPSTAN